MGELVSKWVREWGLWLLQIEKTVQFKEVNNICMLFSGEGRWEAAPSQHSEDECARVATDVQSHRPTLTAPGTPTCQCWQALSAERRTSGAWSLTGQSCLLSRRRCPCQCRHSQQQQQDCPEAQGNHFHKFKRIFTCLNTNCLKCFRMLEMFMF